MEIWSTKERMTAAGTRQGDKEEVERRRGTREM